MEAPSTHAVLASIREFTSLFTDEKLDADIDDLIAVMGRLIYLAAQMKDEDAETSDAEQPSSDDYLERYSRARGVAAKRFPGLELYSSAPTEDGSPTLGDPYDDLADIYLDMVRVLRVADGGHVQDARWDFRFGFETHWGLHASELLHYLLLAKNT